MRVDRPERRAGVVGPSERLTLRTMEEFIDAEEALSCAVAGLLLEDELEGALMRHSGPGAASHVIDREVFGQTRHTPRPVLAEPRIRPLGHKREDDARHPVALIQALRCTKLLYERLETIHPLLRLVFDAFGQTNHLHVHYSPPQL